MKLRVFTLRFDPEMGRFHDEELEAFFEDKDALQVSEHFFVFDELPTLGLIVRYRDKDRPGSPKVRDGGKKSDAWRAALSEEEKKIFDGLRHWRNEKAQHEGKPPYLFLTNRQLHDIARNPPDTLTGLGAVNGVGDAKLEAFGDEIMALLPLLLSGSTPKTTDSETAGDM